MPEPQPLIMTEPNMFGIYQQYKTLPSVDPDDALTIADLCDAPTFSLPPDILKQCSPLCVYGTHATDNIQLSLKDLLNISELDSSSWFASFMTPTMCRLMHWFYSTTTKTLSDLNRLITDVLLAPDFSASHLKDFNANCEAKRLDSDSLPAFVADGWIRDHVMLQLPQSGVCHASEDDAPSLDIPDVWHRSLLDIVRSAFQDASSLCFHLKGFKENWLQPDSHTERVYSEAYTSDAFLEMEDQIIPEPGCMLETVVAPMMAYSDSTCLVNFGTASLWPAYLTFRLMSKYVRAIPSFFQSHHLAYFPVLPDNIQDVYMNTFGSPASKETLTFLKCELMQKIWKLLLDPEFMHAYVHGIVIECADGILHRIYPRFFTYSADYPEKVLLTSIKYLGRCLCPRCLIVKERNAFSEALLPLGFNFYQMFVPDLMHESESGSWKSLFTHLVRICHAIPGAIEKLNKRYRLIPTFGRSTIHKFSNDVSGQKKFAARDYEDILQCSFPCFDGILPDAKDNKIIMDTVFAWATWHAFAKAWMHTDSSLEALQGVCLNFHTRETPAEMAAQVRRLVCTAKKTMASTGKASTRSIYKSIKAFNLHTYKNHAISDYIWSIPKFGTADSYSTQIGEQEHHHVKLFYARTNKQGHVKQIAILEWQQRHLHHILAQRISKIKARPKKTSSVIINPNEKDPLPQGQPEDHYQMSLSRNYPLNLHHWLAENEGNLAIDFIPKLKEHILRHLLINETAQDDDITPKQLSNLHIDSINPRTCSDVIVLTNNSDLNDTHPYWYARIIGLFHVEVHYNDPEGDLEDHKAKCPHHVEFVNGTDPEAFGFLDPDDIIHAIHLIPVYKLGQTTEFLPPSITQRPEENDEDYEWYSVDMWADHDMTFQYCGLGVGHQATWEATHIFREDLCRAYNLSPDVFNLGEDIDMGSDSELEATTDESDSEMVADMMDESEVDADSDEEAEVEDRSDDDKWETDEEPGDNDDDAELVKEDENQWETDLEEPSEDDTEDDMDLDDEAEGELDDICHDDDNEIGLDPDFEFAMFSNYAIGSMGPRYIYNLCLSL
ncbi:uncharacterized protein EV420DRAFT_1651271 [Desarmillaria tabescens]|uniref:Uncharacterized protein n=1 Tax=Armillaria tabescens TaxID=1929756 RepID=A0AA39JDZ5_ARMTA|nr:uncharacterized protein EV420DRAFT_1651271 [Desarmillaria tabescens]KAK0438853.1 hypothetical protein EV420DRAFT_1651271 [Desarmillaria tabescens]